VFAVFQAREKKPWARSAKRMKRENNKRKIKFLLSVSTKGKNRLPVVVVTEQRVDMQTDNVSHKNPSD
jgi:hypothetical protein